MADPFKPAPSVASRFVSQTELSEAQAKREADVRAAYARLGQEPPEEALAAARGGGAEYDPRSLFERLQANKNAKQEKYDEMMKLSNQFRGLDEGETEFLADVAAEKRAEEARKRAEEESEVEQFRRATLARASSPPNPLALLTGSALSTRPSLPAAMASTAARPALTAPQIRKSLDSSSGSGSSGVGVAAAVAGVKRGAEAVEEGGKDSGGPSGGAAGGSDAKRLKDGAGTTAAVGSKAGASSLSRKKKAAAALGIVRKKPGQ